MLAMQHNHQVENNEITGFDLIRMILWRTTFKTILSWSYLDLRFWAIQVRNLASQLTLYPEEEGSSSSSSTTICQPGLSSSAPIVQTNTSFSGKPVTPIAQLNMYQNRWTIKARLTSKSQIRHWSNSKGEGKLFSIELLDLRLDIWATLFREAVDKFYDMMEADNVFLLSGGRSKAANMQYKTCKFSFEIAFDQNEEIFSEDDTGEIVQHNYNLVLIVSLWRIQSQVVM